MRKFLESKIDFIDFYIDWRKYCSFWNPFVIRYVFIEITINMHGKTVGVGHSLQKSSHNLIFFSFNIRLFFSIANTKQIVIKLLCIKSILIIVMGYWNSMFNVISLLCSICRHSWIPQDQRVVAMSFSQDIMLLVLRLWLADRSIWVIKC